MFYCTVLLLLAATADVFGYSLKEPPQVGIIGGYPVSVSEVPYMAHLRTYSGGHVCGGTIIHKQFILSAAHCCYNFRQIPFIYKVAVGSVKMSKGEKYDVEKVFIDEKFDYHKGGHDICLLKLSKEISFGPNVTKVELADENFELNPGMMLNATGWGVTKSDGKDDSDVLLRVSVPLVNQSECVKIFKDHITDDVICAGVEGKGACRGDSGGPLTRNNVQVGITSWGEICDHDPGVYTKISVYLSWINDTIASNI